MYFVREDLVEQSFICCTTHAVQQTTGGLAELSAYDMYIAKIYRPRTIFLFFFAADSMDLSSFDSTERTFDRLIWCKTVRNGHSRSVQVKKSATIESPCVISR